MPMGLKIDPREFVVAWQRSNSIAEVKKQLGLEQDSNMRLSSVATQLRAKGVNLKRMQPGTRYDYDDLASLADWAADLAETSSDPQAEITVDRYLKYRRNGHQ